MEKKVCTKCKEEKELSEFNKQNGCIMGVRPNCRECKNKQDREYTKNNKDKIRKRQKETQQIKTKEIKSRKDKELEKLINKYTNLKLGDNIMITKYVGYMCRGSSTYPRHHFEKKCLVCDKTSILTPSKIERYKRDGTKCQYCKDSLRKGDNGCIEKKCNSCQKWYPATPKNFGKNKNGLFGLNYYCHCCKKNKSRKRRESKDVRDKEYEQTKIRLKNDPLFKLTNSIRNLIRISFNYSGYGKKSKTYQILGCSFEEFKSHIESKFEPWMSWENRGLYNGEKYYGWDLDHIIPISSVKSEEDIIRLNHYTNFQPLCSYTNRYIKKDLLEWNENN
jgi:hypothetical protein